MAREAVIEDQMQVVADTVLTEVNKLPATLEVMTSMISGLGGGQLPLQGGGRGSNSDLAGLVEKQEECLNVLNAMKEASEKYDRNLKVSFTDTDHLREVWKKSICSAFKPWIMLQTMRSCNELTSHQLILLETLS